MRIGGASRPSGDWRVPSFGKRKRQQTRGCSGQGALHAGQGIKHSHGCLDLPCSVPAPHAPGCAARQALTVQVALAGAHGGNELVSFQEEAPLVPVR